jgi:hypothetical protein
MTIDQLIARLNAYRAELGGETEVRLMTQQSWPCENGIDGLVSVAEINATGDPDEESEGFVCQGKVDQAVYLCEGAQLGYGTQTAWARSY